MLRILLVLGLLGCGSEGGVVGVQVAGEAGSSAEADGGAPGAGSGGSGDTDDTAGAGGSTEDPDASLAGFGRDAGPDAQVPDGGAQDAGQDGGEAFDLSFYVGRWVVEVTVERSCSGGTPITAQSWSGYEVRDTFEVVRCHPEFLTCNEEVWLGMGTFEGSTWHPEATDGFGELNFVFRPEGDTVVGSYNQSCPAGSVGGVTSTVWTRFSM